MRRSWPTLAKPTLAKPTLASFFGQTDFGQNEFDLLCVVLCCVVLCCVVLCCVVLCVWRGYLFHGIRVGFHVWVLVSRFGLDRPSPGPPFPWTAQKFALFFPLPPQFSFFPSLSGGLLVEFWWCLKTRTLKCARLEFAGCRVKPRRPRSRRGFTRQPESSKSAHMRNTTKNPREDPQRGKKRTNFVAGQGKKKREISGPPPFGPPPTST